MSHRLAFIDILAVVSGGTALAGWQEQLDWALRVGAAIVAIAAGLTSLYFHFRKRRANARD